MSAALSTRARRSAERGATLFVVVLAVTLLTGVGLYSLHSSALLARASGNQREAAQTEDLAQLGTLAMLSDIASDPSTFVSLAIEAKDPCRMNVGYNTANSIAPPCYKKESATYVLPTGAALVAADSFGPYTAIAGRFHTEATDVAPAPWPVVGEQIGQDGFQFYQAKLTTIAQLERSGSPNACVANLMPIAGQHVTRAHVVIGPLRLLQ